MARIHHMTCGIKFHQPRFPCWAQPIGVPKSLRTWSTTLRAAILGETSRAGIFAIFRHSHDFDDPLLGAAFLDEFEGVRRSD